MGAIAVCVTVRRLSFRQNDKSTIPVAIGNEAWYQSCVQIGSKPEYVDTLVRKNCICISPCVKYYSSVNGNIIDRRTQCNKDSLQKLIYNKDTQYLMLSF